MPPLSDSQKTIIQNYTPEQRTEYNRYRASGFSAQEALNIIQTPTETSTKKPTFAQRTGENIKRSVERTIDDFSTIPEAIRSVGQMRPLIRAAGGAGAIVGDAFASTLSAITPEPVKETLMPAAIAIAEAPVTQKVLSVLDTANKKSDMILGDLANSLNLVGFGALPRSTVRSTLATAGREVIEQGPARGSRTLKDFFKKPEQPAPIAEDVSIIDTARETLTRGQADDVIGRARTFEVPIVSEPTVRSAISRGFDDVESTLLGQLDDADKAIAAKLVEAAERATVDPSAPIGSRPVDILGSQLVRPIEEILTQQKAAGKAVDTAAKTLKGKTFDGDSVRTAIDDILNDAGITFGDDALDFSGSQFQFVPQVQNRIAQTVSDVSRALASGDAYNAHILKKSIDEAVNYAKLQEGLSGAGEAVLKSIRRAIDQQLDAEFANYKVANDTFSDLQAFRELTEDIFGVNKTVNDQRAAQQLRTLFSNSARRGEITDFIENVNAYAKKYGVKTTGNLTNQMQIVNMLERLYGTQAVTSLRGEVEKAIKGVGMVARGLRNPIEGVGTAVANLVERAAGQTPEMQREFLKRLLATKGSKAATVVDDVAPGIKVCVNCFDEATKQAATHKTWKVEKGIYVPEATSKEEALSIARLFYENNPMSTEKLGKNTHAWNVNKSGKIIDANRGGREGMGSTKPVSDDFKYVSEDEILGKKNDSIATDLTAQAAKLKAEGKTFNDFVKKQGSKYYHGTNQAENINKNGFIVGQEMKSNSPFFGDNFVDGVYLSKTMDDFGDNGYLNSVSDVLEVRVPKGLNIADFPNAKELQDFIEFQLKLEKNSDPAIVTEMMKKEGFDGVSLNSGDYSETVIFDPEKLKTKDQLQSIWDSTQTQNVFFHGTAAKDFDTFAGINYFTKDPKEASGFADGIHLGGGTGGKKRVLEVELDIKNTKDIDEIVREALEDGDLDEAIAQALIDAKKEGFDSVSFTHPSSYNDGEFTAYVPVNNASAKIRK